MVCERGERTKYACVRNEKFFEMSKNALLCAKIVLNSCGKWKEQHEKSIQNT